MKKTITTKKLSLSKQTVRALQDAQLEQVAGAAFTSVVNPSICGGCNPTLYTCKVILCW